MNTNKKVLILTIGGSQEPIISSINLFQPEEIVFLCSSKSRDEVSKILKRTDREYEIYSIEIVEPDKLDDVYKTSMEIIKKSRSIGADILADFTGGTKCMSFGLATAASIQNIAIRFMGGVRQDLVKVVDGTQQPIEFRFLWIDYNNAVESFNLGHYFASQQLFVEIKNRTVDSALKNKSTKYAQIAQGFVFWDKFEHEKAYQNLKQFNDDFPKLIYLLLRIFKGSEFRNSNGYELLFDLFANAQRRASHGLYDDACGRLYRAVEFLAQQRLKLEYGIDVSHVDQTKLPKSFEAPKPNDKGIIQLSRYKAYELLTKLNDKIGDAYQNHAKQINEKMQIRNYSILAHGMKPVLATDYRYFKNIIESYLKEAIGVLGIEWEGVEFPRLGS